MLPFCIALFIFVVFPSQAQNIYYIDSYGGKDSNSGRTQIAAWKTINRLNQFLSVAQPGDVIRFRRGRIYEGQIELGKGGNKDNSVTLEAYGTGNAPVVSGAIRISHWKQVNRNMFRAPLQKSVWNVFSGQKQFTLARTPNEGSYFRVDESGNTTMIRDSEIRMPDHYWKDANCRIRTSDFSWEVATVTSSSTNQVTLKPGIAYNIQKGQTFYFDNSISFLDAPDEWFATKDSLYVVLRNASDTSGIHGSVYRYGIRITADDVVIRDLNISGQAVSGIFITDASNVELSGNVISGTGNHGIEIKNSSRILISGHSITRCNGNGIAASKISHCIISGNRISQIGLIPGYGQTGYSGEIGIFIDHQGSENSIRGNTVEKTGYTGIRCDSRNSVIEKNTIRFPMLVLKDGGGIYIWGSNCTQCIVRSNYVENCNSVREKEKAYNNWTSAIYFDDNSYANQAIGNTVNDSLATGIFLHNTYDNIIEKNTIYGTTISVANYMKNDKSSYRNIIRNNTVFERNRESVPLMLVSNYPTDFGTFSSNTYINPYADVVVSCNAPNLGNAAGDLKYWQDLSGQDKDSREGRFRWSPYVAINKGPNLVPNGTFDRNLNTWGKYRDNFVSVWRSGNKMDGGYADIFFTSGNPSFGAFYSTGRIHYEKGKSYMLQFDAASDGYFYLLVRDSDDPVNLKEKVTVGRTRERHTLYIRPGRSMMGKVDFATVTYTKNHLFLDNVSLHEVILKPNQPLRSVLFHNPSDVAVAYSAGTNRYLDLQGKSINGTITLDPWTAMILIRK